MIPVGQRQRVKALVRGLSIEELDELAAHVAVEIDRARATAEKLAATLNATLTIGAKREPVSRAGYHAPTARLQNLINKPAPVTLERLARFDNKEDKQ